VYLFPVKTLLALGKLSSSYNRHGAMAGIHLQASLGTHYQRWSDSGFSLSDPILF